MGLQIFNPQYEPSTSALKQIRKKFNYQVKEQLTERRNIYIPWPRFYVAQVAELVDALASGASFCMEVEVRVFSWAPIPKHLKYWDILPLNSTLISNVNPND